MNDLRQQQMVAATSSSGSESGTAVESAAATSTAGSAGAAGRLQPNSTANNSNPKSVAASSTSEEEQRVSSTSSPAQRDRDQQLNADRDRDQDQDREREQEQEPQQQREEALQRQHNQPGHITSTTASPPPTQPPPTPCDDAPSTTGASASVSAASASASASASGQAAAGTAGGAMAATALEVEGEERDGHKIILKLSKHAANPNSNLNESQSGGDERRVEPLRIQLPCAGGGGEGALAKPQDAFDADASSCSSSCAEDEVVSTLGPHLRNTPHIVPKLTIRAANERRVGSVVPKLTIKLPENPAASGSSNSNSGSCSSAVSGGAQSAMPAKNDAHLSSLSPASASSSSASSSSSSSSSSSLAEMQTVPKLMIKTTLAGSSCISSSEEHPHQQQQIPKLTIKTGGGGGGQEHVHTVIMTHDLNNAQSIPKLTIKTKSIDLLEDDPASKLEQLQPLPKLTIKNLCSPKHKVRAVLEEKVPSAASKLAVSKPTPTPTPNPTPAPAPMTNGGESNSSSQEFCGFSDPDADPAVAASLSDEGRRNSDDMVIDDSLSKEHDPKMFHNLPPLAASNGIASAANKVGKPAQPQHNVVDMVDLTSSPSPGSSPAHVATNNFTGRITPNNLLLECLRAQVASGGFTTAAGEAGTGGAGGAPSSPNSNILLSQLTAPAKSFATATPKSKSSKYPQLTERLMANGGGGGGSGGASVVAPEIEAIVGPLVSANSAPPIIESIEILDTPDGSPRAEYLDDDQPPPLLNNHHQINHKEHIWRSRSWTTTTRTT
ncbi:hypothetical protein M5D96_012552 [Drosophila gunungcola]|uniref:Uncharacterized protein n=1 Tax=Drosophila gunungcola TaxID=103775 RepID=A0A9Q0BKG6_9MUSC|nr:hypothetical protein M5D96_012552 [Drosophila gunungcola]